MSDPLKKFWVKPRIRAQREPIPTHIANLRQSGWPRFAIRHLYRATRPDVSGRWLTRYLRFKPTHILL